MSGPHGPARGYRGVESHRSDLNRRPPGIQSATTSLPLDQSLRASVGCGLDSPETQPKQASHTVTEAQRAPCPPGAP